MRLSNIVLFVCASVACVSCDSMKGLTQPYDASAGQNPLDIAGGSSFQKSKPTGQADGSGLLAGDYVETSLPNTAFYASKPSAGSQPQGVLAQGVVLKVISPEGNFIQVQAMTGETGYVSNAAVVPQGLLTASVPLAPEVPPAGDPDPAGDGTAPGPEIPGLEPPATSPIPAKDPSGELKPGEPFVAPEPEIPGIQE